MYQTRYREKCPCGQTSGWNETEEHSWPTKQRRKKRKKLNMMINLITENCSHLQATNSLHRTYLIPTPLPRMLSLLLIVMQCILMLITSQTFRTVSFANSQVIVDHPKSRQSRRSLDQNPYMFSAEFQRMKSPVQLYAPVTKEFYPAKNDDEQSLFNPKKLSEFYATENIANLSSLPASREKQNEIVRKLSSTMLLETLLRHPFPSNRSPFPSLSLPNLPGKPKTKFNATQSRDDQNYERTSKIQNKMGIQPGYMDVSTTNRSTTTDSRMLLKNKVYPSYEFKSPNNTDNSFNASSLNYLVEKLLSSKPFKNLKPKRPSNRQRSPYEAEIPVGVERDNRIPVLPPIDLKHIAKPAVTLDMLIKDEYDLRVKPLIKSLIDQEKLATGKDEFSRVHLPRNTVPVNHRLDAASSMPTSTLSPFDDRPYITSNQTAINMPTLTPSLTIFTVEPNNSNTLIGFEDSDEYEESDEDGEEMKTQDDHEKNSVANNKSKVEVTTKKSLHNVPPYQLTESNLDLQPKPRPQPPRLNLASGVVTTQATTKNSIIDRDGTTTTTTTTTAPQTTAGATTGKSDFKFGDKATDSSIRGSLIYSDGVEDETERAANRRRKLQARRNSIKAGLNSVMTRNNQSIENRNSDNFQSEKPGSSFLLNQLFSTINPLAELDMKLKEQQSMKNSRDSTFKNPLIYKGYVGKDDYLISSTARDWSRPIGVRDSSLAKPVYRFTTTTTPAPPTDPPSVPYNYFLHQPVTNAQSVPSMVIPTSDPPELTTISPTASTQPINGDGLRRFTYQQHPERVSPQLPTHANNQVNLDTSTLLPWNKSSVVHPAPVKKYSNQIHEQRFKTSSAEISHNATKQLASEAKESENGTKSGSKSESTAADEFEQQWSPTKVVQADGSKPFQKRRQQASDKIPQQVSGNSMNSSTPMLVPMTGPIRQVAPTSSSPNATVTNRSQVKVMISDASDSDNESLKSLTNKLSNGRREHGQRDGTIEESQRKNVSHADHRAGSKRNRLRVSQTGATMMTNRVDGLMGDTDEQEIGADHTRKPTRSSQGSGNENAFKPKVSDSDSDGDDDQEESEDSDSDEDNVNHQRKKVFGENAGRRLRDRMHLDNFRGVNDGNRVVRHNKTTKRQNPHLSSQPDNHEPAGSEILLSGMDKNQQASDNKRTNRTANNLFINLRQLPTRTTTETILIDGNENSSAPSTTTTTASTTPMSSPTSIGSTIIPHSNFYGAASSESPTLDNSIPVLNGKVNQQHKNAPAFSSEDPYQRSSNNLVSTIHSQPISSTSPTPTLAPKSQTTAGPGAPTKPDDTSPVSKAPNKSSNDRLAFILIGGSCALSVVCLVLAAMSMRCQDMCDDYRSLRNAERAALKLQKHRLKYTKNHKINRFNHGGRLSPDNGQIEDLNNNNNASVSEPTEINHSRVTAAKCINSGNSKTNQFESNLNAWNSSNCQVPLNAFLDKQQEVCRCANCISNRWSCQDDIMINGGKQHSSWLHPYYYMQHHARLRPLFGAGSSVGTFFPRRIDDQSFLAGGGPIDAQILIDNQPSHSCLVTDQRGLTRSKSILQKSNRPTGGNLCEISNFACSNPDHNHSHHICHNHHKYNMETSASDDSKMTLDDSILCDNAKCSANHHRHKLIQVRSNGHNHSHSHQTAWKLGSARKSIPSQNHLHLQQSSSDGSIAQCTCSRDHQPLLSRDKRQQDRTSRKHLFKHDSRQSLRQKAKRDKAMLIWSTNRDQLI